jgi:hypothetical protein
MLRAAVALDAHMSADAVLNRLTLQGLWLEVNSRRVVARLKVFADRLDWPVTKAADAIGRMPSKFGAAIRWQKGTEISWYSLEMEEVLRRCEAAQDDELLVDVLELESASESQVVELSDVAEIIPSDAILMESGEPIAVSLPAEAGIPHRFNVRGAIASRSDSANQRRMRRSPASHSEHEEANQLWPRIEAPERVVQTANLEFSVTVGFTETPRADVTGNRLIFPDDKEVELTICLIVGQGLAVIGSNFRTITGSPETLLKAEAKFGVVCEGPSSGGITITTLEARYIVAGTVCGVASRRIEIWPLSSATAGSPRSESKPESPENSPITLAADPDAPDLTIEILKPDRDASSGEYVIQLVPRDPTKSGMAAFQINLGQDAKTFARAIVDEVRLFTGNALLATTLEGIGRLIAQRLPEGVLNAIRDVHRVTSPEPPVVLIVSAEPYVPWELAWIDPPLDSAKPCFLGAQCVVGRWLRDPDRPPTSSLTQSSVTRPGTHPVARIGVRHLAALATWYRASSGLKRLLKAEDEAKALSQGWGAILLDGSATVMRQLLDCVLVSDGKKIGSVDAVHFAGHGNFDTAHADSAELFLEDGTPVRSTMFRAAKYGGDRQPLLFLNACMLGIGGQLLGDMGGFPGNSLRGGFGGVIGALWEVDDDVAHDVAIEFWKRALPSNGAQGEPVGAILRQLRERYAAAASPTATTTYLAYVYYGHPRLRLQHLSAMPSETSVAR